MNWANIFKAIKPLLATLLSGLATYFTHGIATGSFAASGANMTVTAGVGATGLVALVSSIVDQWKKTGTPPVETISELVCLEGLGAALAKDGDVDGLALLAPLSQHIVARKGGSSTDGIDLGKLADQVLKRLPQQPVEIARSA